MVVHSERVTARKTHKGPVGRGTRAGRMGQDAVSPANPRLTPGSTAVPRWRSAKASMAIAMGLGPRVILRCAIGWLMPRPSGAIAERAASPRGARPSGGPDGRARGSGRGDRLEAISSRRGPGRPGGRRPGPRVRSHPRPRSVERPGGRPPWQERFLKSVDISGRFRVALSCCQPPHARADALVKVGYGLSSWVGADRVGYPLRQPLPAYP